ncbi:SDR family NAD(P)-dependent oxidoreductase [Deinococcus planocerae]|uniref:SDR family NAD(P)-dependent oxidoreductase n=1 Tax=Deinococcus planocerae TaxID=1737569 RepID=UPI000C7F5409|nr:glucose 1-dehydrogenase [Deinococcus planocerae]
MTGSLAGRRAVVTGAGRGIGRGVALGLARAGADVALLGRSPGELGAVAREVEALGRRATPVPCDVTDLAALEAAFEGLHDLDLLVNNAGTNVPEPFVDVTPEHFDTIFGLNVRAAFFAAQLAVRAMLARGGGGVIVNLSSQMGFVGAANRSVYCASKHALEGLTKALAVELAPRGIRVVSVAPTFIETPLTAPMFADPAFRAWVEESIPLGHPGTVEDVVGAVVFLASDAARMVTGTSLRVDGGWTAR